MENGIDWKLRGIKLTADLEIILEEWFASEWLAGHSRRVPRAHWRDLWRFPWKPGRKDRDGNPIPFYPGHRRAAKRLLTLLHCLRAKSKNLGFWRDTEHKGPDGENLPGGDRGWLTWNCPPAGGIWLGDYYRPKHCVGKQCRTRYCPWCWLRRYDAMCRVLARPAGEPILLPAGTSTPALGFSAPFRVTTFTAYHPDAFKDPGFYDRFKKEVDRNVYRRPEGTKGDVRQTERPEFTQALRLCCPLFRAFPGNSALGSSTNPGDLETPADAIGEPGIRIAYIHQDEPPALREARWGLTFSDGAWMNVELKRCEYSTAGAAVRAAWPFAIDLLFASAEEVVVPMDRALHAVRYFTTPNFSALPTRVLPETCALPKTCASRQTRALP